MPAPSLLQAATQWWKDCAAREGGAAATRRLVAELWEFVRDSTPERRRLRFGDAGYDWDRRVNTTSGAVSWRDRLLGVFHSAYQPTDPESFREMLEALGEQAQIDFREFTFIDLGSGKGRTLLMAADYPFRRIVGVELLPALHRIAVENLSKYQSESQRCHTLESICADAAKFSLPAEPIVLYLFNPFPEPAMRRVIANLEQSVQANPRPVYVLYHNPQQEQVLAECTVLKRLGGTHQYSIYCCIFQNLGS
jgi:SAM-dependent methyltransferase